MTNFFKVLAANKKKSAAEATEENEEDNTKLFLIIEVMVVTFLVSIIPALMTIGRIPTAEEIYVPILSAILMAIYAYIKIRDIDVEPE